MRPKIVIPVCVLGVLLVALVLCLRPQRGGSGGNSGPQQEATAAGAGDAVPATTNSGPRTARKEPAAVKPPDMAPSTEAAAAPDMEAGTPAEQHQAYVEGKVAELQDLSANNDSESLQSILVELSNRDPEIRKAAVEAAKQFGSRDAIPSLQDAMAQTDDVAEKADINEAIEFLKLPSLTEIRKVPGHP